MNTILPNRPLDTSPTRLVLAAPKLVQRPDALLEPLLARDPELFPLLHDVRKHRATEEDHVLPAWRVLDTDLEFLRTRSELAFDRVEGNVKKRNAR